MENQETNVSEVVQEQVPTVVTIQPEDLDMLIQSNQAIRNSLQELGVAARKLEALKAEIKSVLDKSEQNISAVNVKVSESETAFNTLAKAMANKYGIDMSQRCDLNLNTGVFTVG
jgi:hypothetical protein